MLYEKCSMRGHVKRQIQYEAKLSAEIPPIFTHYENKCMVLQLLYGIFEVKFPL